MSTNPLPSKLAAIRDALTATTVRLHRLVDTLDENAWSRGPGDGRWSIARCIEHLNMTSEAYVPLFRDAFKDARARALIAKDPSYGLDLWGWLLVKSCDEPPRFSMKTPDEFVPPTIEPKDKVVTEYDVLQADLIAFLDEAADLALGKIKITSPFNEKIKYNAYSAFRLIPAHQRRHLWQAERVFEALAQKPR
jgi:hypothetical protein